ncbi:MAG: hypothetical protein HY644_09555 [Acidobacteria bacterium]|nr:hypothetical protein [Acidobacteriota bacterium]
MKNWIVFLVATFTVLCACSRRTGENSRMQDSRAEQVQPSQPKVAPQAQAALPPAGVTTPVLVPPQTKSGAITPRRTPKPRRPDRTVPDVTRSTVGQDVVATQSSGTAPAPPASETRGAQSSADLHSIPQKEEVWARQPEPVPPPREERMILPPGTELTVRVLDRISSEDARGGERFAAILDQEMRRGGRVVIPGRSEVTGRLVTVKESGRVSGRAEIVLELESILIGGERHDLRTNPMTIQAESAVKGDIGKVGGSSALGAIIGAIAGGKKGAAIGATIGTASGTAVVLATRGKPVVIERESQLRFRLEDPFEVVVR